MAVIFKDRKLGTLVLVVLLGIIIGSYASTLMSLIPGESVVKTFFTKSIDFGFGFPNAFLIDFSAIKFQIGLAIKFNLMSIIGIGVSLYLFRWYR